MSTIIDGNKILINGVGVAKDIGVGLGRVVGGSADDKR